MTNYGVHDDLVAAFLEEVRTSSVDTWRVLAATAAPSRLTEDASRALAEVALPASVRTSVHSAAVRAFRDLGLHREDFEGRRDLPRVDTAISCATTAIAAHDQLSPEHLRVLVEPFAQVGFDAARAALTEG